MLLCYSIVRVQKNVFPDHNIPVSEAVKVKRIWERDIVK